jgi:Zn(II)-responsive transcriptional regulator
MTTMSIGRLADRAGVAIDTIRYYERNGLLRPAGRLASGYRRYSDAEYRRLRFIRRAKALGFSLDEIKELLTISAERNVARLRRAAMKRLSDVESRIEELARVRAGLEKLIAACPGHGRAEACPILNALTQDESP